MAQTLSGFLYAVLVKIFLFWSNLTVLSGYQSVLYKLVPSTSLLHLGSVEYLDKIRNFKYLDNVKKIQFEAVSCNGVVCFGADMNAAICSIW
jgi:hypothetical protein